MIVAELTMIGIFGLKKAAIQSVLVIPLLVGTILYAYTIREMFLPWQDLLPLEAALEVDRTRKDNKAAIFKAADVRDYSNTKGVSPYRQPELLAPSNLQPFYHDPVTVERELIAEGRYILLGEATRADVPSRTELLHEEKIAEDNWELNLNVGNITHRESSSKMSTLAKALKKRVVGRKK